MLNMAGNEVEYIWGCEWIEIKTSMGSISVKWLEEKALRHHIGAATITDFPYKKSPDQHISNLHNVRRKL